MCVCVCCHCEFLTLLQIPEEQDSVGQLLKREGTRKGGKGWGGALSQ